MVIELLCSKEFVCDTMEAQGRDHLQFLLLRVKKNTNRSKHIKSISFSIRHRCFEVENVRFKHELRTHGQKCLKFKVGKS